MAICPGHPCERLLLLLPSHTHTTGYTTPCLRVCVCSLLALPSLTLFSVCSVLSSFYPNLSSFISFITTILFLSSLFFSHHYFSLSFAVLCSVFLFFSFPLSSHHYSFFQLNLFLLSFTRIFLFFFSSI